MANCIVILKTIVPFQLCVRLFHLSDDSVHVNKTCLMSKWFSQFSVCSLVGQAESPEVRLTEHFGMNWSVGCDTDLITQLQCWTSLMLL